ncbi:MAG: histidine phosphatase family protein [Candidatus Eisenbacteria bacterium]|nr:histidine phosphatase family protein [Candidatus Eisenbacteria bacterium]
MTRIRTPLLQWAPILLVAPGAFAIGAATMPREAFAAPSATVLRVYVARHGQTSWNAMHKLQGHIDTPLDSTGRAQAARLATLLAGTTFEHVYCSKLTRTRQTAAILHIAAPIDSMAELNEIGLGKFEGLVTTGPDTATIAEYRRRTADPDDRLDTGESENQHLARVTAALNTIRARHAGGNVLIVGHGGTNKLILRVLLGLTREQMADFAQANDELYMIELPAGGPPKLWKLVPPERLKK